MTWLTFVLAGGAMVAFLVAYSRKPKTDEKLPVVDGSHWFFGHLLTTVPYFTKGNYRELHEKWQQIYGDFFIVHGINTVGLHVSDAACIRQVLNDNETFTSNPIIKFAISSVGKYILLTMDGELWKRHRKLLQPSFGAPQLRRTHELTNRETDVLFDKWHAAEGGQVLAMDDFKNLTVQIIGQLAFGMRFPEGSTNHAAVSAIFAGLPKRMVARYKWAWWFLSDRHEYNAAISTIKQTVVDIMDTRIKELEKGGGEVDGKYKDVIDNMLATRREEAVTGLKGLTTEEILDEILTLYLAGHETTSNGLFWCMYCLSQYPEAQTALQEEVDRVCQGREPTYDDLTHMPYVEWFVKETLRLYPPAMGTSRQCERTTHVGPYKVEAGSRVVVHFYSVHRNPCYYKNPLIFDPSRWKDEEEGKGAYFPFGHGPKVCIGFRVAMCEMKAFLARLAQEFTVSLAAEEAAKVYPFEGITLTCRNPVLFTVEPRK